ncbi:MAG: phospho-N-acetylmuramoyl-pentapeptide-transferase [Phycisphaerae bacterium]|nr:phospho-N-acetylmuramoyl-pentapeptide-transferase [Phycisphaerae bacterium]
MLFHLMDYLIADPRYAYGSVLFRATVAMLIAFFVVLQSGPRIIRWLIKKKIGDNPEFDHAELNRMAIGKAHTPTMGGIIIMLGMLVPMLLLADLRNFYIHMAFMCLLWLAALGGIDDWLKLTVARRSGTRAGLRTWEKLIFQLALGVVLAVFIYRYGRHNVSPTEVSYFNVLSIPFIKGDPNLNWGFKLAMPLFMIITVLVIAFTSNAVNLTDGMDGLAGGCVAQVGFVFMVLAYLAGHEWLPGYLRLPRIPLAEELAVVCGAMVGACLGFLWYNCHPAQVFMGDTGSLPLGGLIGYVAVVTRQELMLFIVGGIFVIEAASVILQVGYFKLSGGKRIFRVAPIHHHFHLGGWTETQVVTRFWLLAAIFAAFALATVKLR